MKLYLSRFIEGDEREVVDVIRTHGGSTHHIVREGKWPVITTFCGRWTNNCFTIIPDYIDDRPACRNCIAAWTELEFQAP